MNICNTVREGIEINDLQALCRLITDLEANTSLLQPNQLPERIEALDRFDIFNLDAWTGVTDAVLLRAKAVQAKLEAVNSEVYEAIRSEVRLGRGEQALLKWVRDSGEGAPPVIEGAGYDYLDELVVGALQFDEPNAETIQPIDGMVCYQPTPARHIFDLFDRTGLTQDDVLIDLGSGLGHVALLASICTGARSIGIELEPVYVDIAKRTAEKLDLQRVTFVRRDAQTADLSAGTVFYLYTPFKGRMLRTVLDSVRREGAKRDIRVCTFGECTATVEREDWLQAIGSPGEHRISLFRSRNG